MYVRSGVSFAVSTPVLISRPHVKHGELRQRAFTRRMVAEDAASFPVVHHPFFVLLANSKRHRCFCSFCENGISWGIRYEMVYLCHF
jgi:hypothetical protein